MAQRKKTKSKAKKKRKAGRPKQQSSVNWASLLVGLGIGLMIAVGIYVSDRREQLPAARDGGAVAAVSEPGATDGAAGAEDSASRFRFYEMLPRFEVVIPEEDLEAMPDVSSRSLDRPGVYVLQAGSFSSFEDADRRKAQLALLGIVSNIQKVTIDDKSYHRVRIGPVSELGQLNMLRKQMRDADVEVLVIQVGE